MSDPAPAGVTLQQASVTVFSLAEPLVGPMRAQVAHEPLVPIYCLVCNAQGLEHVYWNIQVSYTNTTNTVLADKMLECVQSGLRAAELARHSEYVCSGCAAQLNLIDEYEAALLRARTELKQKFWQTFIARGQISVPVPAEVPAEVRPEVRPLETEQTPAPTLTVRSAPGAETAPRPRTPEHTEDAVKVEPVQRITADDLAKNELGATGND